MSVLLNDNLETSEKLRNKWIDYLKTIAIFLIIITHDPWSVENSRLPFYPFLVDMAVPIFMIISGYNYVFSCQRKGISKICEMYSIIEIKAKLLRFLFPFEVIYIIEVLLLILFKNVKYTFHKFIVDMIMGGYGPGAYYTLIMVQFVFVTPLLYILLKKNRKNGLVIVFFINLLFEFICTVYNISGGVYSRCILRYLFLIALGICWREFWEDGLNKISMLLFWGVGLIYMVGSNYIWSPIIFRRWTTTTMMTGFYLLPLMAVFRLFIEHIKGSLNIGNLVVICSQATFHIYLFQMLYYYVGLERIFGIFPICIRIICSIVVCVFGGGIFCYSMRLLRLKRGSEKV